MRQKDPQINERFIFVHLLNSRKLVGKHGGALWIESIYFQLTTKP